MPVPRKKIDNQTVPVVAKASAKKQQRSWAGSAWRATRNVASKTGSLAFRGVVNFTGGIAGAFIAIPPASRLAEWMVYSGSNAVYGPAYTITAIAKRHAAANYAALVGTNVIGGVLGAQLGQYLAWQAVGYTYQGGKFLYKKWQHRNDKPITVTANNDDDDQEDVVAPAENVLHANFHGQMVPLMPSPWEAVPESRRIDAEHYPDQWVRWVELGEEVDFGDEVEDGEEQQVVAPAERKQMPPMVCWLLQLHMLSPVDEQSEERLHLVGTVIIGGGNAPSSPESDDDDDAEDDDTSSNCAEAGAGAAACAQTMRRSKRP